MDSRDTGLAGKRIDISAVSFLLIAGIMAAAASFISPVFWIMAAVNKFAGTVIALKNKMTFIDWHERKILRCRRFTPGMETKDAVSFAEWEQLLRLYRAAQKVQTSAVFRRER